MKRVCLGLLIACGGGGGDDPPAVDASVDAGPFDLSSATWSNTPIGVRPDTTALRPDLAITDSGEVVVVWADVLEIGGNNAPILAASSDASFAEEVISPPQMAEYSRPSVSAFENRVHVVFGGPGGVTGSDIFYTKREGGSWSAPVNVSGPLDPGDVVDNNPTVVEVAGTITVLFLGHAAGEIADGLFALSFTDPASPVGLETLLDPADHDCSDVEAVTDGTAIHVVARCTEAGSTGLFYLSDRSGGFVRQTVDLGPTTAPLTPDIALDPEGGVHLLWVGSVDCPSGSCRDVFHSRGLAPPTSVTGQSEDGGFMPVLGVDRLGRVIVAFHRLGSIDDVLWTYAESGGGFVRTQLATPGTADTTDWQPGGLEIDPVTGRPHMAFLRSLSGNSDVVHGELR